MIPTYDPAMIPTPPAIQTVDLSAYPGAIVTTYGDISFLVLLVGAACLVAGWYIGQMRIRENGEVEA